MNRNTVLTKFTLESLLPSSSEPAPSSDPSRGSVGGTQTSRCDPKLTQQAMSPARSSAPEPLRRPVPPPEPYPVGDLGPILSAACASLQRVIQAPDAICGASLLAAASLATQGLADVENGGRVHPLSLWFLSVAESGERKSAIDHEALSPAREVERELARAYDQACAINKVEVEEWTMRKDAAKKAAAGANRDELADALRKVGPEPLPPLNPQLIVADFTAEGLAKLLAGGRPSIGAFTDEAALVFGGHGMTKESIARTCGTLSTLWGAGELDRIRASGGPVKLYGRRFALHLMAQPVIAERALSDEVLSGQGFAARCLLAWPEGNAGHRLYRDESLQEDPAMICYRARLKALLRRPLPTAEGQRNELNPRRLILSPDAKALWCDVHDSIERQMAPTGRYAVCKPWASKAAEQCLRIAGVLTLIEDPDAQQIERCVLEHAAELTLWHLNEAVRLAGTATTSSEVRNAEAILSWCHATGRTLLHSGEALRLGPARIRESVAFRRAMEELTRTGWAQPVVGGMELDGRHRRHVWIVLPASEGR